MDLKLQDNIIIVTGGASGIGEAICRVLALEGAIPCIIDRNQERALKVVRDITDQGGKVDAYIADLTEPEACSEAVKYVVSQYGRIDGLVNNAGLNDGIDLENGKEQGFVQSLVTNAGHYQEMVHHAVPHMIRSKGAIVNISSKVGETGQGSTSGYAASNGIRNAFTLEWSKELEQYGIRVNSIIVAECMTPQYEWWIGQQENPEGKLHEITSKIPLGNRMTTPHEIANMAVFLLSAIPTGINGQLIHVDGGYVHLDRRVTPLH